MGGNKGPPPDGASERRPWSLRYGCGDGDGCGVGVLGGGGFGVGVGPSAAGRSFERRAGLGLKPGRTCSLDFGGFAIVGIGTLSFCFVAVYHSDLPTPASEDRSKSCTSLAQALGLCRRERRESKRTNKRSKMLRRTSEIGGRSATNPLHLTAGSGRKESFLLNQS